MNQLRWLLRAKRWTQHPPSPKRVKFVFAIILVCVAIVVFEKTIGLPDWMQVERQQGLKLRTLSP